MLLANFDRKEHLQHRAVSLRQHGFLVTITVVHGFSDFCVATCQCFFTGLVSTSAILLDRVYNTGEWRQSRLRQVDFVSVTSIRDKIDLIGDIVFA